MIDFIYFGQHPRLGEQGLHAPTSGIYDALTQRQVICQPHDCSGQVIGGATSNEQATLFVFDDLAETPYVCRNDRYSGPHGFER
jgi:hypothetical protein